MELLKTKLGIPIVSQELVPRPELLERLKTGFDRKLTLISAPAGFGKTTLLAECFHQEQDHGVQMSPLIAWISLDKADNDLVRFWAYFLAASRPACPEMSESCVARLFSEPSFPIDSILTSLLNGIAASTRKCIIVLDDYHCIQNRAIHETVQFFLDHLPAQAHLVISTRNTPRIAVARLRGQGQVSEFGGADLRFTLEDSTVFLNDIMALHLSDTSIGELHRKTEGWIASLQMAAVSLRSRNDMPGFVTHFSGTHLPIMDYLLQEILFQQTEETRSFLLQTSILDRLNGPLCDVITGGNDGMERLERLIADNLFLVPLDEEGHWYRYHQLFADLLRNQLERAQPDNIPLLHHRACRWFQAHGFIIEAVYHAMEISDVERAADLVESVAVSMLNEGRIATIHRWLTDLPIDIVKSRPRLALTLAGAELAAGKLASTESLIRHIEASLEDSEDDQDPLVMAERDSIRAMALAIRATIPMEQADMQHALNLCEIALKEPSGLEPNARAVVSFMLGMAYTERGDLDSASRHLSEAGSVGQNVGNHVCVLMAQACLGEIQAKQGHLHQAASLSRGAIELGIQWGSGETLPATALAYICVARMLYQWNSLEEAFELITRGIELSDEYGEWGIRLFGRLNYAQIVPLQQKWDTW